MAAITESLRDRQIEALKGSIKKWEEIVAGTGVDKGTENCPCCEAFFLTENDKTYCCAECPVYLASGASGCSNTPYTDWAEYTNDLDSCDCTVYDEESKQLAIAELEYLKQVLADLLQEGK
jgi:hypothetical protein